METQIVSLTHVQKKFGKFQALKDVTFDVKKGEVLGFIGPNGAGKSTTIRILLGMLKKNSGDARIFGKDVWQEATAIHQKIAYVPGDVYLWPNLTGGEIIDLLLRLNGQQRSAKTEALIEKFQLDPKKKARTYSKGNRQKVALVAALSQEAELYIFDEPTSGLDPLNEKSFQEEVLKLKVAGKSILLSSHILSEVEKMCDRIAIIRAGEIIEVGDLASMRHLTRMEMTVETQKALDGIEQLAGVHKVEFSADTHRQAVLSVDREELTTIMNFLAEKQIINLTSTPPTLEDLFLRYYEKQGADSHE
ncbi:ABC transporter ATP-binding protein [Enterococcus pseudoavium]|uniref:ABC transporter ATP-binding protein n=1 Tax=Enterococcus pseudoavium TaxID=44007 RepID=A0AAE4I242_9ENTE|nr:ABC transporter ATP-binding protein [Enterococcus pseudoavium]MDT2736361.1 ABC transporter ATP-binding protein [Enterococcus pseudoavium]